MTQNVCKNKFGFCRYRDNCAFRHDKLIYSDNTCNVFAREKRHPENAVLTKNMDYLWW